MSKKSTNTNCLKGMICPECDSMGPFRIVVKIEATIHDHGHTGMDQCCEWVDESPCSCCNCSHAATVKEFTEKKKRR